MREYYDLWDRFAGGISPQGRVKETVRRTLIRRADTYFLKHHVTRLFTISKAVNDRLRRWNGVSGTVLHPPPPPRPYRCDRYGEYLFFTSRLSPLKRADLVLQALARPESQGARAVIGGDGEERARLERLARELDLGDRVRFEGFLTESALLEHLANCRAVVFPPQQEDYGFVTVEAFASGKPVITCTDSGGPLEFVRDRENGLVVAPEPVALARACAELTASAPLAERLGAQGRRDVADLTWPKTVAQLLLP
jgi:glycosyltransferase involved in cell wall biosynthesis